MSAGPGTGDGAALPGTRPGEADPEDRALELAFRHLNRRDRTAAELRAHLLGRDLPERDVDSVLARLCEDGYVDDARYARLFAQDKRALEAWGAERIERALRERGVDRELIAAALAETADGEDERGRALSLLRRRFPDPPGDRRERERALGVLVRKGFASEVALDALAAHARGEPDAWPE